MYCKACGKFINEGDKFCSQCGAKVEEKTSILEDKPKKPFHIEEINWNLDGYPTEGTKKTEEIEFNWKSVLEEKNRRRDEVKPETPVEIDVKAEASMESEDILDSLMNDFNIRDEKEKIENFSPVEEPTKIINRDQGSVDKFYTLNKKNEEFQALLDLEYEKLMNGGGEEEQLPICAAETETDNLVGVVLSTVPKAILADEESDIKEEGPSKPKEAVPERKLTFDDVFGDEDDEETQNKKPKKKNRALKVIAVILCILVILELAMIGIQTFAADTPLAQKLNDGYLYIVDKIMG